MRWNVLRAVMAIGERIKTARVAAGLSQQQLADVVGTHVMGISKWERGIALPNSDSLGKLTGALGVSADYLLGRTDDPAGVILESDLSADEKRILALVRQRDLPALLRVITDVVDDSPEHGVAPVNQPALDEDSGGQGKLPKPRKK